MGENLGVLWAGNSRELAKSVRAIVVSSCLETNMSEQQKITIIEGPPPVFEDPGEAWPASLGDSIRPFRSALTRMRTFNGPALVERCYHAWKSREPIVLEFRAPDGRIAQAPIQAARYVPTVEGQLLMLWVRLNPEEVETEKGSEE